MDLPARTDGHSGKNKVNEFDHDAWTKTFDLMTKEKEEKVCHQAQPPRS
jgi:hypothetical protein